MNPSTTSIPSSLTLQKVDRVGVVTSVLCAIHCGLAPILLLTLPNFGRIWAHPASHILVAIFVVPLAIFSIRKGYRAHRKRWILVTASIGILSVLIGAMLPAFSEASVMGDTASQGASAPAEGSANLVAGEGDTASSSGCVDNCCPSLQVTESGETSLHIPPAAIVTTLGGIFLITAHIGNLCSCGHACRSSKCSSC